MKNFPKDWPFNPSGQFQSTTVNNYREMTMTTKTFSHIPYALAHDEGERVNSFGALLIVVKATSPQTGGAFNMFEVTCPPGYATSLKIHYAEDVAVYVLEGTLTFFWGSEKKKAVAGSYLYQPWGIPHGFRVEGSTPARILYLTFPASLDRFALKQGLLFPALESVTSAARYQIETLGPLPEAPGEYQ